MQYWRRMQSVYDKPEQFSANVGSLESAGSQAAEPNDGRKSCKIRIAAAAAVAAAVSAVFGRMGTAKYVLDYARSARVFFCDHSWPGWVSSVPSCLLPQLALFSSNIIHPERKHSSPSCVLPQLALFLLIHIEFIQKKKFIKSPPSFLLPRFTLSHLI